MKNNLPLTKQLRETIQQHIVLLEPLNPKNNRFKMEIWTGGYQDLMYHIADLTKVCMLALEASESCSLAEVPSPHSNIGGVLSLILNMIPYEEAQLLDILHQGILSGNVDVVQELCDESFFLTPPSQNA